jgi:membrane protease YdiL (CAAX protease family)
MIREVGERALLFLVPFAIYGVYLLLVLRQRPNRPPTPWALLFIVGLVLFAASFVYVGLTEGETTKGVYVAPHVVNGKIVPGHVETK